MIGAVGEQLAEDFSRTETFVTLFHAWLQSKTGELSYVDAGHGIAAVLRSSGGVEVLGSDDLPLGISIADSWTTREVVLNAGDSLVIASDGLLDLLGDNTPVADAFNFVAAHAGPSELCMAVGRLAEQRPPTDNVTIVALRRD